MKNVSEQTGELSNIIAKYEDLFTHVFVAAGSFGTEKLDFVFESRPDEANVYDLASITKAVITVPLVFEHLRPFSRTIEEIAPNWNLDQELKKISVDQLLNHTSGLPAWANFWIKNFDDDGQPNLFCDGENKAATYIDKVLNRQKLLKKGSPLYSDIGFLLLQRLLEFQNKKSFLELFEGLRIKYPLWSVFQSKVLDKKKAVKTGFCELRKKEILGEVHDENSAALGGFCGHAGAFATGEGFCRWLQEFTQTSLGSDVMEAQQKSKNQPFLSGWWAGTGESSKCYASGKAIGHLGFTGTGFWIDPEAKSFAVVLCNKTVFRRKNSRITQFRRECFSFLDRFRTQKLSLR